MMYSRLLKRKVRSPYLDIINAEVPYARQGLRAKENREFQEKTARDRLGMAREAMKLQESQAKKAQMIQVGQLGLLGAYGAHKLGWLGGGTKAAATPMVTGSTGAATGLGAGGTSAAGGFPLLAGTQPLYPGAAAGGAAAGGAATGLGAGGTSAAGGFPLLAGTQPLYPGAAAGGAAGLAGSGAAAGGSAKLGAAAMYGGEGIAAGSGATATTGGIAGAAGAEGAGVGAGAGLGALGTTAVMAAPWVIGKSGIVEAAMEPIGSGLKGATDFLEDVGDVGQNIWDSTIGAIGDLCIIITAATNPHSYEVNVTREYRDRYLSQQTLRGYYMVAEKIVPLMYKSKRFKKFIKKHLVDHIVRHCEWGIGLRDKKPLKSSLVTTTFLGFCDFIGSTVPSFIRNNGEVW